MAPRTINRSHQQAQASSFRRMEQHSAAAWWVTWAACAAAAIGALVALVPLLGGSNRLLALVPVFVAGGVLAGVAAWLLPQAGWMSGLAYAGAALAMLYAMLNAIVLPLRLSLNGICPVSTSQCPTGFEHPVTASENVAVYGGVILAALALVLIALAVELRYLRRPRPSIDSGSQRQ